MLRKLSFTVILLAAAIVPAACGTQEKRPSQDILIAKDAFALLDRIRRAYEARDMEALRQLSSKSAYDSLGREIRDFRSASLEFQTRWVDIKEGGSIEVQVAWSGRWNMPGGGAAVPDSGRAVLVLSGRPLKLVETRESSPFAAPLSRE